MQPFTERVIGIIQKIPRGSVMTYGQIAELAGSRHSARQVVRILHSMSERYSLPWHRVVNAQGRIVIQDDETRFKQFLYLRDEDIAVSEEGWIDLNKYRYVPTISNHLEY